MAISPKHRRRMQEKLAQMLRDEVNNGKGLTTLATVAYIPCTRGLKRIPEDDNEHDDATSQAPPFLSLPGEIRNEIYDYFQPSVVRLKEANALMLTCKQVHQEFTSMTVAKTKPIVEEVVKKRIFRLKSNSPLPKPSTTTEESLSIATHTQLQNVNLAIGLIDGLSAAAAKHNPGSQKFASCLESLKELLGLHLPFITISVALHADVSIADIDLRARNLRAFIIAFERVENDPESTINAQHVIFELARNTWEGANIPHPPIVAFVRREKKEDGESGFEALWHNPLLERRREGAWYGNSDHQEWATEAKIMARLEVIVAQSRRNAGDGV
ncbi:hypothetical protein CFE70_009367 [Pyrenophora teres f. teres 0-1]|uniref:Uncharacterized protein n=2 Tax=Pyrenophora teres f. teres TaxID=97479 RepID=E3RJI8_PYRTT|nr:hypothetical protein PTT_08312 [Pyrenophora teres f. teres 0-1]KAE8824145.1 hypothetical protein HRS9139_09327 [Pyrenophora teres f. teres]KAE8827348.1 hypothetical protein PTNB85_08701 [Pyrenophora teres f. teres]KAE8831356.1 hypothetical protein HRS9122_08946 [Pyrenophora teres f. teres]KAE8855202.1 hypothetical protein PTNB29_09453 [Pyrenophora teres f. teres]